MNHSARGLSVLDRGGPEGYQKTLDLQQAVHSKVLDARPYGPDKLILVEHEPVFTGGRGTEKPLSDGRTPWFEIARGGKATYHGPGQLVAYPIFDLDFHGRDVHQYLRRLETVIIKTLGVFGVEGFRREGFTGVWVKTEKFGEQKIASIGIGVRKWVSYHGIAINLNPDLAYFRQISPCGLSAESVTSLAKVCKDNLPRMDKLKATLVEQFAEEFGFSAVQAEEVARRPNWLKARVSDQRGISKTNDIVQRLRLTTVCEEARCPNLGECWAHHTATFMIMGELCTRRCGFCSVQNGDSFNLKELDALEPLRVAKAVSELGLEHVVITSVNRDDVHDMGATHFLNCVRAIKHQTPSCRIELLIPDMRGERRLLETILSSGEVAVLNHNLETVPRLYKRVRPGAVVERSLNILKWSKEIQPDIRSKSGIMVGLGEECSEVEDLMHRLREVGVDILTIGQYLQPTVQQLPIVRYVCPEEFEEYRLSALKLGFSHVESAPFVRSSYHAWKHSEQTSRQIPEFASEAPANHFV